MTISANVRKELFEMTSSEGKLIRIKPTEAKAGTTVYSSKQAQPLKMWTQEEHERFLEAMEKYPAGPWKVIASFIGSKTTRQTMTHAQKYRQKISRWRRGLRHKGRKQVPDCAAASSSSSTASFSGDEADYCAKENLFRAIEYVSGDDSRYSSPVRALPLGYPSSELGGSGGRSSELFKLAELASFEVMKQEPPHSPVHPYVATDMRLEMKQQFGGGYDAPQPVEERQSLSHKLPKVEFRPSREWCTRKTEIKLSPLRGVDGKVLSAVSGLSFMNAQNRVDLRSLAACGSQMMDCSDDEAAVTQPLGAGAFRLPPLNMATGHHGSAFSIPPLRSKIDPSVLGRAQFATN